jgi:crotonobetaine/carnitine-CoA ligase
MIDRDLLAPNALVRWAAKTPDAPVLVHVDGSQLTYAELLAGSRRRAGALERLGVGAGTHVATMLPNHLDAFRVLVGLGFLRAIEVPLNPALIGDSLTHALAVAEPTVLVTTPELARANAEILRAFPLRVVTDLDEVETDADRSDWAGPEARDTACLLFTSGTTGPSKAVISPWGLTLQMWSWVPDDTLNAGDRLFSTMPLFHNSGRSAFNYVLARGACLVTRDKFSASSVWDDVRMHGCQVMALVGPLTALLHSAPARADDADNPVERVILGPMIPDIAGFEQRFGVRTAICYGQTEIGAPIASTWEHGPWQNCGRERTTWPFPEVRIVDEDDEPVPAGQVGELIVRAEPWSMMQGYYGEPEKTAAAWRNGWFHTGDAFRVDADGWYYFVDRMHDAIRRRGENISSFEVEAAVAHHPLVRECAAIGICTAFGDDEVMAAVIAEPGLQAAELHAFLDGRMPAYMRPRYIRVVDDLPRNATTGRVRKNELRAAGVTADTWDALADPEGMLP